MTFIPWAWPAGMTKATRRHFHVSREAWPWWDQPGTLGSDMLNKQGGAGLRPCGVLLITFNA